MLFPKYAGGVKEIIKCIEIALKSGTIEIKKLVGYALKVESKAVLRRLGYIIVSFDFKIKAIENMRKYIGKGYELFDPNLKRKNNFNKKWPLDVNI